MTVRERQVLEEASKILLRIYDSASLIAEHEECAMVRAHVKYARDLSGKTIDSLDYFISWGYR